MDLGKLIFDAEKILDKAKGNKAWRIEYEKWKAEVWKLKQMKGND